MRSTISFEKHLIAPCGMNCGTCIVYLHERNRCAGCRIETDKPKSRAQCIVKNCEDLKRTESKFCFDCDKYPCKRIIQLDKRYRTKYRTSFIENLNMIKEEGIGKFLIFEAERRRCPACGSVVSVHKSFCLNCKQDINIPLTRS
jgi:hypothetical protein